MISESSSPVFFGVAGPTGGGKSTFVAILENLLYLAFALKVFVLKHDDYYRDLSHLPMRERDRTNFDRPDAVDNKRFIGDLRALKRGEVVKKPIYDFKTHTVKGFEEIDPKNYSVIIPEGIMLFCDPEVVEFFGNGTAYVDVSEPIFFLRRLFRDRRERDRTTLSVCVQYLTTVRPGWKEFVEPTKARARIIVIGGGYHPVGILQALRFIKQALDERGPNP